MDIRELIQEHTDSCLRLANAVALKEARGTNLIFSPLALNVVLAMVAAGSKGQTAARLLSFLRSKSGEELNLLSSQLVSLILADGSSVGGPAISSASGVWVDQSMPLKASFAQIVKGVYGAEAKNVDFQTKAVQVREEVNTWAEGKTNGLIKELLPSQSVDASSRLILANALYFKGAWKDKFDASVTKEGSFYPLGGNPIQVPFMTSKKKQLLSAFLGFKVLKLPYGQGEDKRLFSMYWFLPDERDGLHDLSQRVLSDSEFINRHIPYVEAEVGEFMIPKFKISYSFEASGVLKQMGLDFLFSDEADLTEMVDSPLGGGLTVSSIHHRSFIEVNEEGTEAAAAAAGVVKLRSVMLPQPPIDFVVDHPFLFLIREDLTGVHLFVGHVLNPLLTG